ncbi:keratin, type I cytoskeletal 47 kDa-like, partial [Ascaphus truei]|uniref:keratin, type I cytoskeletal 47 kDa-like n=1 Tax=Ascaphus truei TaxID=8439 RepID=UPI003F59BADE
MSFSNHICFSPSSIGSCARFVAASGGSHVARSAARGAGNLRMSSTSAGLTGSGFGGGFGASEVGVFNNNKNHHYHQNGKETMQNLNDRLASYLDKVHSLENANSDLEMKIREYYEKKTISSAQDFSGYYDTINLLRSKISDASCDNARMTLQLDNATLAAEDFRMKFESELAIRLGMENDLYGLRRATDELTLNKSDLEMQIEGLKEELIFLKRSHDEELLAHRGHGGGSVNVELDSAPATDLVKVLADVRDQYEVLIEKNRKEVEAWHRGQCDVVNKEVAINTAALQTSKTEVTDLKRTFQSLEIELQSLLNMNHSLDGTVSETEERYGAQLQHLQAFVSQLESDLHQVRSDSGRHSLEYRQLLDTKTRLEMEIATYKRLLDGDDFRLDWDDV